MAMMEARLTAAERRADEQAATIAEMKVNHADAIADCSVDVNQIMNYLGFKGGMRLDPSRLFSRFTDGRSFNRVFCVGAGCITIESNLDGKYLACTALDGGETMRLCHRTGEGGFDGFFDTIEPFPVGLPGETVSVERLTRDIDNAMASAIHLFTGPPRDVSFVQIVDVGPGPMATVEMMF